jgi:hypothetical protein
VLPFARTDGTGGFWHIKTAAEADWPPQSRLLEIMDNHDGTLSIFNTVLDHSAPTATPTPGTNAAGLSVNQMASLNREFAYNDPQKGGGTGEGSAQDRNVELLVRDPRQGYVRPRGATPLRVPLVPAFATCNSPGNRQHGAPLSFPSCAPPTQESSQLTVGTPESNGRRANSIGYVLYRALIGDVGLSLSLTDVRRASGLTDYTGELRESVVVRMTDRRNGPAGSGSDDATMVDTPLSADVVCSSTADPDEGSSCVLATTFNALIPGAVREGDRAIWQLAQVEVLDGGPDGDASTPDNKVFARQGLFVP